MFPPTLCHWRCLVLLLDHEHWKIKQICWSFRSNHWQNRLLFKHSTGTAHQPVSKHMTHLPLPGHYCHGRVHMTNELSWIVKRKGQWVHDRLVEQLYHPLSLRTKVRVIIRHKHICMHTSGQSAQCHLCSLHNSDLTDDPWQTRRWRWVMLGHHSCLQSLRSLQPDLQTNLSGYFSRVLLSWWEPPCLCLLAVCRS